MSILNMILAQVTPADTMIQQATDTLQQAMDTAAQVVTDSAAAIAAATAPVAEAAEPIVKELSMWELIKAGGWFIMIPLALLAIVSIYIFFERLFAINHASRQDRSFMDRIKEYIHRGEVDQALKLCQDTNTPYSRMIEKGVTRIGRPMNDVLVAIENVGNMEVAKLEKGFSWLATTAAGAPMIGFLGTVIGMVQAFFQLASAGNNSNVTILASGIYQALVTTVAGLIVGIIALFAYNFLTSRVNRVMNKLEGKTMEFMDLLNEPAK
jgi:biopolymer transport protein ExbB